MRCTPGFQQTLRDEGESEVTATVTESDSWPTPIDEGSDVEKKGPAQLFPTIVSFQPPEPEPLPRPKPTWWSDAWEMLDGMESESPLCQYMIPMSGEAFRHKCESDIHAIDLYCSRSVIDPVTGESRLANEQDDENQVVGGVMWSDEAITMSAVCRKGQDPFEIDLHHLKKMLEVVPNGRRITLHTTSEA
jgi:hypothetical protein